MTLTQILQKIRSAFYTKAELDLMGGGVSLDATIKSKANTNHNHNSLYLGITAKAKSAKSADSVAWANVSGKPSSYTPSSHTHDDRYYTESEINTKLNSKANTSDLLPVGSYIQFAGSKAPTGFLVCNGGAISRTTYAKLFAVIGTKYGSGDGSTTFNLPNLTDRFLQGSTTSGTVKNAGLPNITGGFGDLLGSRGNLSGGSGCFSNTRRDNSTGDPIGYAWNYVDFSFGASRSNSIYGSSSTVQPPALTCLICIKY